MKNLLPVPLLLVLLAFSAQADTTYVPDHYPSIQIAIQSPYVEDGDVIIVRPGTYNENIDFLGKAITVKSELGAETAIIDGGYFWRAVMFQNGEGRDSVLDGFTVTGGSWYGIHVNECSPSIINNIVIENESTGIYCYGGDSCSPLISGNTIADNPGGGIYCFGRSWSDPIRSVITNNIIMGNTAREGGGVFTRYSELLIAGNTITGNFAMDPNYAYGGGGIYVEAHGIGNFDTIIDNVIENNQTDGHGGGIYLEGSDAIVRGNVIASNIAHSGAGIYCYGGKARISENIIRGNEATSDTGVEARGGGMLVDRNSAPEIINNVISGNTTEAAGGGLHLTGCNQALIACNVISENVSGKGGGGIGCNDCSPRIVNCTISMNDASIAGGGMAFNYATTATVGNCIVWGNTAPNGSQIYLSAASTPSFHYCNVEGGWPGTAMLDADPSFVDAGAGDFHLAWDSPCRNAGNNSFPPAEITTDFEGDTRFAQSIVDMGADEFYPRLYSTGKVVPGGTIRITVLGLPWLPQVLLLSGYSVLDPPLPTIHGDLFLESPPAEVYNLGLFPANGAMSLTVNVPSSWKHGESYPFQALVGPWGDPQTRLTNLMTLEVE